MKKYCLFAILAGCNLFPGLIVDAQVGWKWGKAATSFTYLSEGVGPTVTDNAGNVYAAFQGGNDSVTLGTIKVYTPGGSGTVVTKADSSGNFDWARPIPDYEVFIAVDVYRNLYV